MWPKLQGEKQENIYFSSPSHVFLYKKEMPISGHWMEVFYNIIKSNNNIYIVCKLIEDNEGFQACIVGRTGTVEVSTVQGEKLWQGCTPRNHTWANIIFNIIYILHVVTPANLFLFAHNNSLTSSSLLDRNNLLQLLESSGFHSMYQKRFWLKF